MPASTSTRDAPLAPVRARRRKLAVRTKEAAALIGVGLATFERLAAAGKVPAGTRLSGCRLWCVRELAAWADHGMPDRVTWAALWPAIGDRRKTR